MTEKNMKLILHKAGTVYFRHILPTS